MTKRNQVHAHVYCDSCGFVEEDGTEGYGKAYAAGYRHWKRTGHEVNIEVGTHWVIGQDRPRRRKASQ